MKCANCRVVPYQHTPNVCRDIIAERAKREEAEREVLRLRQIVEHWNLPEGPGDTVRPRVRMIAVLQHLREQGSVGRVATGYEYADELEAKFGRD